ncbi:MAG: aldo/keto reductase [Synergistaceae bacterium]|nr:aldo/keto reductase [Synergistaceae bacterium]
MIPQIALGAWAWGNDGTFGNDLTEEELRPVFEAGQKAGLNLWDTAFVYGMGKSEHVLGKFLRTVPRESYLISTKFTPQCADMSAENPVTAMYEGSAERLGTKFIDYFWIHNPLGAPEWTRKLIPLAKSGNIGKIGLSNHNLAELNEAAEILAAEGLKVSAVQNHYSLLNRSSEYSGILEWCRKNGAIFFSYMVLEQGALSGKYSTAHPFPKDSARGQVYNPVMTQLDALNSAMKEIADAHGVGVAQLPVAWAIAKGTLPILGVTKVKHVEDAVKAAGLVLTDGEMRELEALADKANINTVRIWEKEVNNPTPKGRGLR